MLYYLLKCDRLASVHTEARLHEDEEEQALARPPVVTAARAELCVQTRRHALDI